MGLAMRNTASAPRGIMTGNVFIEIQLYVSCFASESWPQNLIIHIKHMSQERPLSHEEETKQSSRHFGLELA